MLIELCSIRQACEIGRCRIMGRSPPEILALENFSRAMTQAYLIPHYVHHLMHSKFNSSTNKSAYSRWL